MIFHIQIILYIIFIAAHVQHHIVSSTGHARSYRVDVRMPDVSPQTPEQYICTYKKISSRKAFITNFEALASMKTAHHILLFGCKEPAEFSASWKCGMSRKCSGGMPQILYAWARNAPPLALPEGVGAQVGSDAGITYLVIQIHYARALRINELDRSGLRIHFTTALQPFSSGIYLFNAACSIPAHAKGKHCDVGCKYRSNLNMVPFAYRTHTHELGRSVSAYRIRDGNWVQIGIGSPQAPQAFYPTDKTKNLTIITGDYLAARCTYDAPNRTHTTRMGATSHDEMCNFYMMFYTVTPPNRHAKSLNPDSECYRSPRHPLPFPPDSDKLPSIWNKLIQGHHSDGHSHGHVVTPAPKTKAPVTSPPIPTFSVDLEWEKTISNLNLGQVSGLAMDIHGDLLVFHRGSRVWGANTFDEEERLVDGYTIGPIKEKTILRISPKTCEVLERWGDNMFYLPHGITVDKDNNVWMTDVGAHQVLKFRADNHKTPDLILGKILDPGDGTDQFCKPTDVAIQSNGVFFVADGYCNSRIMKFSSSGTFIMQWGHPTTTRGTRKKPGYFSIPHSLALDEAKGLLYIADRENGRIQTFKTDGTFYSQFKHSDFHGTVYAVALNALNGGSLYAVSGPSEPRGFTLDSTSGKITNIWSPNNKGFSRPHDVACSKDNSQVFVAEIGPNKVWKFKTGLGPQISSKHPDANDVSDIGFIDIGLQTPEADPSIIPAIIVVVVLATPILLICVAGVVQNIRLRQARRHVMKSLDDAPTMRNRCCGGIFATSKYYYDGRKGFDKLIGDGLDSDSDEDLFIRRDTV